MTSPKQITKFALIMAGISILGIIPMALLHPDWGILSWWPLMGLGLSVLLLAGSFFRGAYLTAQKRVASDTPRRRAKAAKYFIRSALISQFDQLNLTILDARLG